MKVTVVSHGGYRRERWAGQRHRRLCRMKKKRESVLQRSFSPIHRRAKQMMLVWVVVVERGWCGKRHPRGQLCGVWRMVLRRMRRRRMRRKRPVHNAGTHRLGCFHCTGCRSKLLRTGPRRQLSAREPFLRLFVVVAVRRTHGQRHASSHLRQRRRRARRPMGGWASETTRLVVARATTSSGAR